MSLFAGANQPFTFRGSWRQRSVARRGVARCTYPFRRLRANGGGPVTVAWRDLTTEGALGLYWPGKLLIELDVSLVAQPELAASVILSESAHAVDAVVMSDVQRAQIVALMHPGGADQHQWFSPDPAGYLSEEGEAFMACFVLAFSDVTPDTLPFVHKVTPEVAGKVRAVLL